jgi:post-segregation antitoxin (ccd killing protein)
MKKCDARSPAPDIIAEARVWCANVSEAERSTIATELIAKSRHQWRGDEGAILVACGYAGADGYWAAAMAEPTEAATFAHLLALHLTDPSEKLTSSPPRSLVHQKLNAALRLARRSREDFFIDCTLLRPREAALWLLRMPKRRDLVPAGLLSYLEKVADQKSRQTYRPLLIQYTAQIKNVDSMTATDAWR